MQWITLVPEDAGLQNLKADNRRPVITRSVDAVSPYPSAHAPRIGEGIRRESTLHKERRSSDRRTGNDRRRQNVPVLLDTRSKHDRRSIGNRRMIEIIETDSDQQHPRLAHLNLYA